MTENQSGNKPVNKLSKFGRPFQEKTIAAIFTDKKFTEQIIDMLKPKYYENSETLEWIVDKTQTYWEKYRSLPTKDYFTTQANKERLDDVLKHSVTNTLTKINHHAENSSDLDYVKEEFLEFAKNQEMRRAILQSVELLESGQYDSIRDIIDSAINAGMDKDIGSLYTETLKDRISEEARITIPTPWNALNDIMDGGLGPGELGTIIGSTGSGKTWCLCSIGLKAAMRGKFVAHYSLELSESNVNIRYDSILSELSPTDVKNNETRVQNSINENIPGEGEIVTKFWPAETVGVQSIRAHIAQLEAIHRKPDLIIVDYADLLNLGGSNSLDGDYERAGRLYVKLRSLAAEMNVPCWTVSQSNRDGEDADIITLKMIADSYKKAMHSDFIASISVTDSTEEDNMAMGSMNIIKNRFGSDTYVFPMILDFSRGFMQVYNDKNEQYEKNRSYIKNQSNKETREKTAPVVDQVLKKLEKQRSQNNEEVSSSTNNNRPGSRHTFSN